MNNTIITSVLSSGALTLTLLWLSKTWLSERLRQSIAHDYAQLLERYKAEISAQHAIVIERSRADQAQARALRAVGEDYLREAARVAHAKRIEAIQLLWSAILRVTAAVPEVVVFGDVLTAEELAALPSKSPTPPMLENLSDQSLATIFQDTQRAGEARLMAGEYLYSLYDAYCIVVGRAVRLAVAGRKSGRIELWYRDPAVQSLMSKIFSQEEMQSFSAVAPAHYSWLRTQLERKFLACADEMASGTASALSAVAQARAIQDETARLAASTLPADFSGGKQQAKLSNREHR